MGRRIRKSIGSSTTYFYYDTSNEVIAEYEDTDTEPKREFVYGNGLDEILCMFLPEHEGNPADWNAFLEFCEAWLSVTGNGNFNAAYDHNSDGRINLADFAYFASVWDISSSHEPHFYYLHDAMGSVRGLIGGKFKRQSDREFYNYDVYGASTDTSAVKNPFRFAAYYHDSETGLYSLRARTYDPQKGRFIQFDPIGYADSMNLYEYCLSNPTNYADPLGLWTKEGMLREYEKRYGDKGKLMLLGFYANEYTIEYRDYWLSGWDYEDENQVLGISDGSRDLMGKVRSNQDAAKLLYKALNSRYGSVTGEAMRCLNNIVCGASMRQLRNNPDLIGDNDQGLIEELTINQPTNAMRLGTVVQEMTVDEAKAALITAVGMKCAEKILDAIKDARAAKKLAKSAKRTGKLAEEAFEATGGARKANGPSEAYNRAKHYGKTPTKQQRNTMGATSNEVLDHDPPLVKRYYEGDPAVGEKPGHLMTDAERRASANDLSRMNRQPKVESNQQGGQMSNYSKKKKKELGL